VSIDDNQRSREAVLARVRAALGRNGPDDEARAAAHAYLAARTQGPRPTAPSSPVQRFLERATDMASTTARLATVDGVPAEVARYLGGSHARAVCWPELASLDWVRADLDVDPRPTRGDDAVGITGCFCAIAETGTLVFASAADAPPATFLLPETHVAIVHADQVVAGMEDAFARLRSDRRLLPRAVNLVSGPSRTGDIEQTIVLGAHGPRRVHIILIG
jgi:L-lactate dehydrogenase complex protein LldG